MSDNPRTEILIQPEWSTLIFGDGHFAMMQAGTIEREEEGVKIIEVTIKPHSNLRKAYNIRDDELVDGKILSYPMKKIDIIPLNEFDDSQRTFLYIKNYNHKDTDIGNISWDLRTRLEAAYKRIWILEGELIFLSEQIRLAKTNPIEYASQPLEIFDKIYGTIIDAMKNKKEKED